MKNEKSILRYSLFRSALPAAKGAYVGRVVSNGTLDEAAFAAAMAANRPNIDAAAAKMMLAALAKVIADAMAATPCRCSLGEIVFEPLVRGSFSAVNSPMGPGNRLELGVRLGDSLRTCLDDIVPVRVEADELDVSLRRVMDAATERPKTLIGTEPFVLSGVRISATGPDEGVTVVAADGTEVRAEVLATDRTGERITARLVSALPPGPATVCLATRGFGFPEDESTITLRLGVTVLAGEEPSGPTFTKVTAPGHEDDPDWVNKVSRDGQIVILGTGFTDAVTAEFSTDGTPETFNVTARTATSITGQIAGGLEAGGTLAMELKDGAGDVIDTASVEVVE